MRRILTVAALGLALSSFSLAPATAQEAERVAAISACSAGDVADCEAAVAAFIFALGALPPGEADAALADLALELAESASPGNRATVTVAIRTVAAAISDPTVAAAAVAVANDVAAGVPLSGTATVVLASPS